MKRLIELAVESGREWQSDETGFIHYHHHRDDDEIHRSIPSYENFLFALALFRTNLSVNIIEAKEIVERLLHFQREDGSIPLFIDQYPRCYGRYHGVKILPIFHWILVRYGRVLGKELLSKLEAAKEKLIQHAFQMDEEKPAPKQTKALLLAISEGKVPEIDDPVEEILLAHQITGAPMPESIISTWHQKGFACKGATVQKGYEPVPSLYDLYMGYFSGALPDRCTKLHPILLQGALIQPTEWRFPNIEESYAMTLSSNLEEPLRLVWGDQSRTHTLVCQGCRASSVLVDGSDLIFTFNDPLEYDDRTRCREISFFLDVDDSFKFRVGELPATTFKLGDTVTLSQKLDISLSFHLEEGEGDFLGHIMRGNRPNQIALKGNKRFNSYDWSIFLRTISRTSPCKIRVSLNIAV